MPDDIDAEAERAANAARAAVKQTHRGSSSLLPVLAVGFAILTAVLLLMTDRTPTPVDQRTDAPTTTQQGN